MSPSITPSIHSAEMIQLSPPAQSPNVPQSQDIKLNAAGEKAERDAAGELKNQEPVGGGSPTLHGESDEGDSDGSSILSDCCDITPLDITGVELLGPLGAQRIVYHGGYDEEFWDDESIPSEGTATSSMYQYWDPADASMLLDPNPILTCTDYLDALRRWQDSLSSFDDGHEIMEFNHHIGFKKDYLRIHNTEGMIKNYGRTDCFHLSSIEHTVNNCFHCYPWNKVLYDNICGGDN